MHGVDIDESSAAASAEEEQGDDHAATDAIAQATLRR
jgi:hypothetical protein